ncbi:MAG: hypothetical protein CBC42_00810 [Betaproteobacteria bacterium TMED82]|nr:MAG: hypothetical protein CBC42_00810 [Betaproteobacteria bacterium TMED82]|tara:strand:+ start:5978 stop:7915 length:1938 start_codon:yes stop_codon:yes gene_type:complete
MMRCNVERAQNNQNSINFLKRNVSFFIFIFLFISFYSTPISAVEFESGDWSGSLETNVSLGSSWRAQEADNKLYSAPDGARAGLSRIGIGETNTDSGNVNYGKGDAWSTLLKATIDYSLRRDDVGLFARVRAWHDYALESNGVRAGNGGSGYSLGNPLSDHGFAHLSKFSGAALLDAYVYNTFDIGEFPMQVRLGNQVINWGESLFVQGINQINPIDLTSLRRPGTEIRDAFLPIKALSMNLGLGEGKSVEAFYQFEWSPANLDSCGTYWSPVEFQITTTPGQACSQAITTLPGFSNAVGIAAGANLPMGPGLDGPDSDQYGVALRLPVDKLDGELGLYAMKFSSRIPYISGRSGSNIRGLGGAIGAALNPNNFLNPIPAQVAGAAAFGLNLTPGTGLWEYPGGTELYGLSFTTNVAGWSIGSEVSYIPNLPVQINANDLLAAILTGVGPMGATAVASNSAGAGDGVAGYDRINRLQIQINGIKVLPRILGSSQSVFVGEIGYQRVNIGDSFTGNRYGRHFVFGYGQHALYGGTSLTTTHPEGSKNDGYVTENSWGYRLRVRGEYPGVWGSPLTLYPTLSLRHDVSGFSADSQFLQDRIAVGLNARFNLNKVHNFEVGYVYYADSADYDAFRDRDYVSVVLSSSF